MKPAPFEYERPRDIAAALKLLAEAGRSVKVMAGAQSLGPMLNLRLAQPDLLVDVKCIEELTNAEASAGSLVLGSCVTHAAIEDGRVPDATRGLMSTVAADIAYRAVRNRGTIGGSVCHADPAADWVSVLALLDAVAIIEGAAGRREVKIVQFMTGAFSTALAEDEILVALRIPMLSSRARWGHYKICRKPGEFAEAIGAVLHDPERGVCRAVIGAINSAPHVIENADFIVARFDSDRVFAEIDAAGLADHPYERSIQHSAMQRAAARMAARA